MSLDRIDIERRLDDIEKELADLQAEYSDTAEQRVRTDREFELRMVRGKFVAKGNTQTEKKDRALDAIATAEDDLYSRHVEAEAVFEGKRAAVKVLEQRAMIGMALLKSQRETGG